MKILHLSGQPHSAVGDYRTYMPSRALTRHGVDVTWYDECDVHFTGCSKQSPSNLDWLTRIAPEYDLIHVTYPHSISELEAYVCAREAGDLHLVFDCDDDVYHVPTYNTAYGYYHVSGPALKAARISFHVGDAVSVTTKELHSVLHEDTKRCVILPNCIEPSTWEHPVDPNRDADKSVRILFSNSMGHYGDLCELKDALCHLMDKYDGTNNKPLLRPLFFGFIPDWAQHWAADRYDPHANRAFVIPYSAVPTYRQVLRWLRPDIIAAPLQKNTFNESKSHIKIYDAAMSGAAFICTDWPTYGCVPPETCIKVDNTFAQWQWGLEQLIEDASLRNQKNALLKQYVLDEWIIDSHIHKWVEFYESVLATPRVRSLEDVVRPGR